MSKKRKNKFKNFTIKIIDRRGSIFNIFLLKNLKKIIKNLKNE